MLTFILGQCNPFKEQKQNNQGRCERKVNKGRKREGNGLGKMCPVTRQAQNRKREGEKEEVAESSTSSWRLLACPKERVTRSRESSRGAPARHDYNDSNTRTRGVTTKQSTYRQTRRSHSHTNTNSRSIPHTPSVCSQAMPEVKRDKKWEKSKRGRQLAPVELQLKAQHIELRRTTDHANLTKTQAQSTATLR